MARKSLIILALAAVAFAGCNKNFQGEVPAEEGTYEFTLKASAQDMGTKTLYDGDVTFSWQEGDEISVLFSNGSTTKFFTLTAQSAGASTTFKGDITTGYTLGNPDGDKWAIYPADNHTYNSDGTISFNQPAVVDFTQSGFSAKIPLYAYGDESNTFVFKPMVSVVKFTFTGIKCSTVKFQVTATNTHSLSGLFPCQYGSGNALYWYAKYAAEGTNSLSFIEDVSGGKATFYVPVPAWDTPSFKPIITLTDYDTDDLLYTATAKQGFPEETAESLSSIVICPPIKVWNAIAWTFPSAYGIDWESVTAAADGDSGEDFDAIVRMKATADATNLYIYLEVKKDALYDNAGYHYANCSELYIGSGSATEGKAFWAWENVYFEKKHEAWLKYNNTPRYYHWDSNITKPTAVEHGDLYYYEIAVTRSAIPALAGSSAILGIYMTGQWVEGEAWMGSSDAIGCAPARWEAPLEVALP